jgi:rhodanese-related sulfurtransferase
MDGREDTPRRDGDEEETTAAEAPLDVGVAALAALRRSGTPYALVDVREPWELEICRFSEAVSVPLAFLPDAIAGLPRDRPLVVVCHHGVRSRQATLLLRELGFRQALNLSGGIDAWAREVDPDMAVY